MTNTANAPAFSLQAAQKILVRGVNWLGDAVMTTPALQRLREASPHANITLLTPAKLTDLWRSHPAVDTVMTFDSGESLGRVARRLRGGRFDLALVLPNSPRSALEAFFAGIPQRIGYARAWRNWFLTQRVPPRAGEVSMRKRSAGEIKQLVSASAAQDAEHFPETAHHIFQYLHLVAALGANPSPLAPRLVVADAELASVKAKLLAGAPEGIPWLGLNPNAEYGPAKRWPLERFIETAVTLHRRTGYGWLIVGGPSDVPLTHELCAALQRNGVSPAINLAGRTTLRELCAALKLCRVLLTNDSGPMHVAAAVGTPVVVPFGSTASALTGPGWPGEQRHAVIQSRVPCSPCFRRECPIDFRCLRGIGVEHMVAAVLKTIQ